MQLEPQSTTQC